MVVAVVETERARERERERESERRFIDRRGEEAEGKVQDKRQYTGGHTRRAERGRSEYET